MLKKLNGNITKLLCYIKNNLVSCVFKFSILSTMLILVYLVCILSQTDSVSSSDNSGVYPIENSQKLMLTIPTENPSETSSESDGLYSTTESLATIHDNLISKNDNIYIGTHPLFPLEEPMTTPMPLIGQIKLEKETLPEETIVTTPPVLEYTTEEELGISFSTEENITEDSDHTNVAQEITSTEPIPSILTPTIPEPDIPEHDIPEPDIPEPDIPDPNIPEPGISVTALPIKRSITLDEIEMLKTTSIETTTESLIKMTTPTIIVEEPTETSTLATNFLTTENSQDVELLQNSSTPPPAVSEDDLFMDNWGNHISAEKGDQHSEFKDDSSLHLNFLQEPTKSLFQNEGSELASIESPILKNESNDSSLLEQQVNSDIESTSHLPYSDTDESAPIFSPQNLLNLFAFDHQPASSNLKTTWWPKSKSSSMTVLAESAAKSQKKRANRISPHDDSQEMIENQRMFGKGFDTLLNRRLKNSVSIFEKLFGNYFLQ